mmetsp:Transcript_20047/g.51678  ORF Transcript_20047/g.51678 Transcript_20047/m.51678 type:complete len:213 (-) Transcript_20047:179-817(-)
MMVAPGGTPRAGSPSTPYAASGATVSSYLESRCTCLVTLFRKGGKPAFAFSSSRPTTYGVLETEPSDEATTVPSASLASYAKKTSLPSSKISHVRASITVLMRTSPSWDFSTFQYSTSSSSYSTVASGGTPSVASPSAPNATAGVSVTSTFSPFSIVRIARHTPAGTGAGSSSRGISKHRGSSACFVSNGASAPATLPVYLMATSYGAIGLS